MSENCLKMIEKTDFLDFPVCSGCFSLLLSHPGWGPATGELQTTIGDFERSVM